MYGNAWYDAASANQVHNTIFLIQDLNFGEMILRIFLTKSFLVICVRLLLHHSLGAGIEAFWELKKSMNVGYCFMEATLGPKLVIHTNFLPESWIFRFCEEYL